MPLVANTGNCVPASENSSKQMILKTKEPLLAYQQCARFLLPLSLKGVTTSLTKMICYLQGRRVVEGKLQMQRPASHQ